MAHQKENHSDCPVWGPGAHHHLQGRQDQYPHFLGVGSEAQTGEVASWGHAIRKWSGASVQTLKPILLVTTVALMSLLIFPLCTPSLCSPPGDCVGCGESAVDPLTSLVLFTTLQKSCTCHPGPPTCPAASARSTPWPSCAPIFGRGPMPTPLASRSPSPSPQRQSLQLPQSPAGWLGVGGAPFRKPLRLSPSHGFHKG